MGWVLAPDRAKLSRQSVYQGTMSVLSSLACSCWRILLPVEVVGWLHIHFVLVASGVVRCMSPNGYMQASFFTNRIKRTFETKTQPLSYDIDVYSTQGFGDQQQPQQE
jgi:hypothetical protein